MNINAAAMALSTGDDLQNMQRISESMASVFAIANKSIAANRIVQSGIGIQQEDTDTTSGLSVNHAIATKVINIGELLYNVHNKAEASTLASELTKNPVILAKLKVEPSILSLSRGLFMLLQAWEGVVISVSEAEFVAKIHDRTHKDNPEEEVILSKEEINPSDKDQVVPGAVFYWSIGYKDAPGEPRRRVSQIRFRRLPAWSQTEISMANKYAETLRRTLVGAK